MRIYSIIVRFRPLMGIILFNRSIFPVNNTNMFVNLFPSPNGDYFI